MECKCGIFNQCTTNGKTCAKCGNEFESTYIEVSTKIDTNKKGYPFVSVFNKSLQCGQVRNECWNCGNYFDVFNPENYASKECQLNGGKMYLKCNHCGKDGNHL